MLKNINVSYSTLSSENEEEMYVPQMVERCFTMFSLFLFTVNGKTRGAPLDDDRFGFCMLWGKGPSPRIVQCSCPPNIFKFCVQNDSKHG